MEAWEQTVKLCLPDGYVDDDAICERCRRVVRRNHPSVPDYISDHYERVCEPCAVELGYDDVLDAWPMPKELRNA